MCKWAHNFLSDLLLFGEYILSLENTSFDLNSKLQVEYDWKHHTDLVKRSEEAILPGVRRCDRNTCSTELVNGIVRTRGIWLKAEFRRWNICDYLHFCIWVLWKDYEVGFKLSLHSSKCHLTLFIFQIHWTWNSNLAQRPHFTFKKTEVEW